MPRLRVAPLPGDQRATSDSSAPGWDPAFSRGSPECPGAWPIEDSDGGASPGRPDTGADRRCFSSLPISHAFRTTRPPERRTVPDSSMSSVTTRIPEVSGRYLSWIRWAISSSAVDRPEYRTSTPDATCRATSPCSGEPSRTTVMATAGGTTERSRPINAAAGSGAGERRSANKTFVPSTTRRVTPSRTRRSSTTRAGREWRAGRADRADRGAAG